MLEKPVGGHPNPSPPPPPIQEGLMRKTKRIGVVALLESQKFGNKIHQNQQLLVYFGSLIIILRF